ncbi:MAG: Asp-tRNA(Asn)/Glu-tRNA(Gln) amidotransferase GatCAB subunit A, partial [Victivallales bacterium]|nr:Asp-tRNA(Asn)/Glu-tRNA(Gln) amidotransferase GatCAB subunit A [Victivallales bacterium]
MKKTLHEISNLLNDGSATSMEVCESFLAKTEETEPRVHAFVSLDKEMILRRAAESDGRWKSGSHFSPLDGVPVAVKDNIMVEGSVCSCASKILSNLVSPYNATVVSKMLDAGMIPFGRTNMDEFAMGSSCENSALVKTANPHDPTRVPGGSSGGSSAAVAAGEVPAALGSDTGGSIRQPASFCGV